MNDHCPNCRRNNLSNAKVYCKKCYKKYIAIKLSAIKSKTDITKIEENICSECS